MEHILIDSDVGMDDIAAIMLLIGCGVKIDGISTVSGVARAKIGAENLSAIFDYLNLNIPISIGSETALKQSPVCFSENDRKRSEKLNFLRSLIKRGKQVQSGNVEDFIFENLGEKGTLIALGPLTNIAKTIEKYGEKFTKKIDALFLMGGGIYKGNVPPEKIAEYNILLDPKAAGIVFESGIKITMAGVDAASYVPANNDFKNKVKKVRCKSKFSEITKRIIEFNDGDFSYFYDPLLSAVYLEPSLITKRINFAIKVKTRGKNRGQTIIDTNERENVEAILEVDSDKFYSFILQTISK